MSTLPVNERATLVSVRPPRLPQGEISTTVRLMESLRGAQTFSLELAFVGDELSLRVRAPFDSDVRSSVAAQLVDYDLGVVPPDVDPMCIRDDEVVHTHTLIFDGPTLAPVRTVDDATVERGGSDPLSGVVGALVQSVRPGERVVVQLVLKARDDPWPVYRSGAESSGRGSGHRQVLERQRHGVDQANGPRGSSLVPIVLSAIAIAVAALLSVGSLSSGVLPILTDVLGKPMDSLWPYVATGVSSAVFAGLLWVWARTRSKDEPGYVDPDMARQRLDWVGFEAELQVHAVVPQGVSSERRALELSSRIASEYSAYDSPAGARVVHSWSSTDGEVGTGLVSLGKRSWNPLARVLRRVAPRTPPISSLEVASLWHPLHPSADHLRIMPRMRHRPIAPGSPESDEGVLFGVTTGGAPRLARFSREEMSVHHFYIGGTRMGKSSLMLHGLTQRMQAKAQGQDDAALIVVDPHSDLISAVLPLVPRDLRDRVWLIDLASPYWVPAINVLDTREFPARDLTCDGIARVARGIWGDFWGPRMETVMAYISKALYEANLARKRESQYTIVDARLMLTDADFRREVLRQVEDPTIVQWWLEDFEGMPSLERSQNVGAIRSRLAQFAASERVGQIFGQSASTVPLSRAVANGDVILVDTAPASVGREVASLMGASMLNLVDSIIRRSGQLDAGERRKMMVVIDEAQTIPGVNYEEMLGEAAKFGATFVLATQSLEKLDRLSRTGSMRSSVMANAGCVVVFSSEYGDAEFLASQMGREFFSADDVRGLPSHHAYIQSRAGGENAPPYSVRLLRPDPGDRTMADSIRRDSRFYSLPADVAERQARERTESRISGALTKLRNPRLA